MFRLYRLEFTVFGLLILVLSATLVSAVTTTKQLQHQASVYAVYTEKATKDIATIRDARSVRKNADAVYATLLAEELAKQNHQERIDGFNIGDLAAVHDTLLVADLEAMELHAYQNGKELFFVPIVSKGSKGTRWETPAGLYDILTKEPDHFSSIGEVHMPYSMQFFGNFFIHGWPTYPDGSAVPEGYSGGCIRLNTEDAQRIFDIASIGNKVLVVHTPLQDSALAPLSSADAPLPRVSASSYIVADILTGTIYAQKEMDRKRPIASVTKLMTALTANALIRYDDSVSITAGAPIESEDYRQIPPGAHIVSTETVYPLLMESNNAIAHALARHYGTPAFLAEMAHLSSAIGMTDTHFADASGISPKNVSTVRDLFKLAQYLYQNSEFLLKVTRTPRYTLRSNYGTFTIANHNHFASRSDFIGGKTGYTSAAGQTMLSVFTVPIDGEERPIAIIILNSNAREADVLALRYWAQTYIHKESSSASNTVTGTEADHTVIVGTSTKAN